MPTSVLIQLPSLKQTLEDSLGSKQNCWCGKGTHAARCWFLWEIWTANTIQGLTSVNFNYCTVYNSEWLKRLLKEPLKSLVGLSLLYRTLIAKPTLDIGLRNMFMFDKNTGWNLFWYLRLISSLSHQNFITLFYITRDYMRWSWRWSISFHSAAGQQDYTWQGWGWNSLITIMSTTHHGTMHSCVIWYDYPVTGHLDTSLRHSDGTCQDWCTKTGCVGILDIPLHGL